MPVKMCHQPCNSKAKDHGMPIARFKLVSEPQIIWSMFQSMKPDVKNMEPQVASFLTSRRTILSGTRWLIIERVLSPTATIIIPIWIWVNVA